MSYVVVGATVRIYYDDDSFDEGEVTAVVGDLITVDFYDWIERWNDHEFRLQELFYECREVLIPIQRGTIMVDFRSAP
jgi:hypothetical protein